MGFKIVTLFESTIPPFTWSDDWGEIDFETYTQEDIAEVIKANLEAISEDESNPISVIDDGWEEGYRDMFNPNTGHRTVPDGYHLVDWDFDLPEKIIISVPYVGVPKEESIPKVITISMGFDLPNGGSAVFNMKFPLVGLSLDTDNSRILFTLGAPQSDLDHAEPPEADFYEPDHNDYY